MSQDRCIIINALPRTGSNILWNIVSSHPSVSMPGKETGEIIRGLDVAGRNLVRNRFRDYPIMENLIGYILKMQFHKLKVGNINDNERYQKSSDERYSKQELEDTITCLKSIGKDYFLNDFIAKQYQTTHFIGLIRNGYSFCNGMERRGHKPREAAELYKQYVDFLLEQENSCPNFMLIRFENLILDPFFIASQIYEFLQLKPIKLQKLRLKSKRVMSIEGDHKAPSNLIEGQNYWFNQEEIKAFLDKRVNKIQTKALTEKSAEIFSGVCSENMQKIGYQISEEM